MSSIRIPSDPNTRKKWIAAIESHQKFDHTIFDFNVCEKHFKPTNVFACNNKKMLIRGVVPTIFTAAG